MDSNYTPQNLMRNCPLKIGQAYKRYKRVNIIKSIEFDLGNERFGDRIILLFGEERIHWYFTQDDLEELERLYKGFTELPKCNLEDRKFI